MKNLIFILLVSATACGQTKVKTEKYPNGKIKEEVQYIDNKKNGYSKSYSENGNLEVEMEYKNDSIVGTMTIYNENGTKYSDIDMKSKIAKVYAEQSYYKGQFNNRDMILDGIWEEWITEKNIKRFIWTFVNGKKDGEYKAIRTDGSVEAIGHYKNGTLDDTLKSFNEKGQLIMIEIWKADADGKSSTSVNKIYLTDTKPDQTVEVIDGKIYIWKNGKKEFLRKVGE